MFVKKLANLAKSKPKILAITLIGIGLTLVSTIPGTGNYDIDQWLPYLYAITNTLGFILMPFGLSLCLQHYDLKHGRNSIDYEDKLAHLYLPVLLPAIIIISLGLSLLPINTSVPATVTKMESGVTYVTYSPKCKFCQKAEHARNKAVNTYNYTHSKKVQLVNLDENTKLTKQLKKHLKYNGMFASQYTKKGRVITATQIYTTGTKVNGKIKPTAPSDKATYERLVAFINNNQ